MMIVAVFLLRYLRKKSNIPIYIYWIISIPGNPV